MWTNVGKSERRDDQSEVIKHEGMISLVRSVSAPVPSTRGVHTCTQCLEDLQHKCLHIPQTHNLARGGSSCQLIRPLLNKPKTQQSELAVWLAVLHCLWQQLGLSASLSVCQSICVPVYLCASLSVCQSICVPVYLCASLSVCQSIYLPGCLSVCLSVCLAVSCCLVARVHLIIWAEVHDVGT